MSARWGIRDSTVVRPSLPTNVARIDFHTQPHMAVEFFVGFCPCSKGFSLGSPSHFSLSTKTITS